MATSEGRRHRIGIAFGAALVFMVEASGFAIAQTQTNEPNATDLHAAYCMEILKADIALAKQAVSFAEKNPPANTPNSKPLQDAYDKMLENVQDNLV